MIRTPAPSAARGAAPRRRLRTKTPPPIPAGSSNALVGTWTFTSAQLRSRSGDAIDLYGPNPRGILVFTSDGHFVLMNTRPDRSPYASGDSMRGTPAEYEQTVHGTVAYFGRYTVDAAGKTFRIDIEGCSFPNYEGTRQVRPYTLRGDRLTFLNPSPTVEGMELCATLVRAKPAGDGSLPRHAGDRAGIDGPRRSRS